jgi:ketosteroid isomerase-like protein
LPAALVLVVSPAAVAAQETQDTTRLPTQLRSARGAFQSAYLALDPSAAGSLFTDSAVVDFQGQIFSGRVAIVETFLPQSTQGLAALRFGTSSFTISEGQIVENGNYFVVPEGGSEQAGSYRTTWRRQQDGGWKVARLEVFASG